MVGAFQHRLLMFVCVDPLLQKHLQVKVYTIICFMNLHELTFLFTHLMSCSHHCLYSWSSMAGNCLETFDMHVNNSLQNLMFWATVLPLALGIFLVGQ